MFTVQIRSRIVGNTATPTDDTPDLNTIALDLLNETLSVEDLIRQAVEEQVRDLILNRKLDAQQARKALNRQYLTDAEVAQQAAQSGMVRLPTKKKVAEPRINPEKEAEKAVRAFEQGAYILVVDGYQPSRLDEEVTLKPTSKITFLRLTPLVGG